MAKNSKLERNYQAHIKQTLETLFPGSIVRKQPTCDKQGIPDLEILYHDKWAMLECKREKPSPSDYQPNQEYYIDLFDKMSFCRMICPENEKEVLDDLQQALKPRRKARISRSK